jgi:hypothetical protein
MADKVYDIGLGSGIDITELKKGLSEAEQEVIKSAAEMFKTIEKSAQEQTAKIREQEAEKVALIKKGMDEQIAAVKAANTLSAADKQKVTKAIKDAAAAETKIVKNEARLQEAAVKSMAAAMTKTIQDNAKKQLKAVQDGYKGAKQAVTDFAKGAIGELMGLDQVLASLAGGPAAIGKLVADMSKKAVAALNEMAESWRQQEQVEVALANAAKNNPYLNDRNVRQLKTFADEMQRATGIDNVAIMQTETRLASLGRNQNQMQKIIKTAADMAKAGVMDFDSAVFELNNSYNGLIRTSGRLYPELKNLSKEAFASGEAIDIIAKKVEGSAAEAMKTGAGSVQAYQNALGDLKKSIGQDWEKATQGFRVAFTNYINSVVDARNKTKELQEAIDTLRDGKYDIEATITVNEHEINELRASIGRMENALLTHDANYTVMVNRTEADLVRDIELEKVRLAKLEEETRLLKEGTEIRTGFLAIQERINAAAAKADTPEMQARIAEAELKRLAINHALERGFIDHARYLLQQAEATAQLAEAEAKRAEKQNDDDKKREKFREDYKKKLEEQKASILKQAELEGKSADSMEVKKQLLDAQMSAYKGLLESSEGLLNGELKYEQAIERTLTALRERHEVEQWNDEQRKKNLQELANRQGELESQLKKIYEDVQGEAKRQAELTEEKAHQEELTEIRKTSVKAAIEYEETEQRNRAIRATNEKKQELIANKAEQLAALDELEQAELAKYREGHPAREAIEKEFLEKKERLNNDTNNAITAMELNLKDEIVNINTQMNDALKQLDRDLLEERLRNIKEFLSASQQIAGNITATWTNIIDYQTEEKRENNRKMVQSDEDRARKEKEIMIESANRRYKAELFAWSANVTMASATAALAALEAYKSGWQAGGAAGGVLAGINMALAVAMGAMQIAAVASAMPKPPRFHSGGVVQGRAGQEVTAILRAGEPVLTQQQFGNTMQAIANLAQMKGGGATVVQPQIEVNNTIANQAQVNTRLDGERIIVEVVNKALGEGRLNQGLAMQNLNAQGATYL